MFKNINININTNSSHINTNSSHINTNSNHINTNSNHINTNNVCNNCGRGGHLFQQCKLPITSYGIIVFRVINALDVLDVEEEKDDTREKNDTKEFNSINTSPKKIEYLMIRRKDSFGYIDFIRGKYSPYNVVHLQNIINEMSEEEKKRIMTYNFSELWIMMWGEKSNIQYRHEEALSYKKFELIKNGVMVNNELVKLESLIKQSSTSWTETEWEFPKGRRNNKEKDLVCAVREFEEETGLIIKNSHVIEQHILNGDTELNIDDDMIIVETDKSKETKLKSNILKHSNRKDATERDINVKEKNTNPQKNEHSIYVIENILPLEEIFIGTNNKLYKHKYFLAYMENEDHDLSNFQKTEVSKLEWKTLDKCIVSIRPYNYEKKKLIRNVNSLLNDFKIYK
jgi:hypothetical protein